MDMIEDDEDEDDTEDDDDEDLDLEEGWEPREETPEERMKRFIISDEDFDALTVIKLEDREDITEEEKAAIFKERETVYEKQKAAAAALDEDTEV